MSQSAERKSSPLQTLIPNTSSIKTSFDFDKEIIFNTSDIELVENEIDEEHAKSDDVNIKDESNPNNGEDCINDSDPLPKPNDLINEELSPSARLSQRNMTVKVRKYFH